MKIKKKLSLKGMTLMEIIISIAVMALLGMIVVVAGVGAVRNIRIAHNVSEKNANQSPYASAKTGAVKKGDLQINFSYGGQNGVLNAEAYEVIENENTGDRVGNYRYFVVPTKSPS